VCRKERLDVNEVIEICSFLIPVVERNSWLARKLFVGFLEMRMNTV
jgi:hypothetical protein